MRVVKKRRRCCKGEEISMMWRWHWKYIGARTVCPEDGAKSLQTSIPVVPPMYGLDGETVISWRDVQCRVISTSSDERQSVAEQLPRSLPARYRECLNMVVDCDTDLTGGSHRKDCSACCDSHQNRSASAHEEYKYASMLCYHSRGSLSYLFQIVSPSRPKLSYLRQNVSLHHDPRLLGEGSLL